MTREAEIQSARAKKIAVNYNKGFSPSALYSLSDAVSKSHGTYICITQAAAGERGNIVGHSRKITHLHCSTVSDSVINIRLTGLSQLHLSLRAKFDSPSVFLPPYYIQENRIYSDSEHQRLNDMVHDPFLLFFFCRK